MIESIKNLGNGRFLVVDMSKFGDSTRTLHDDIPLENLRKIKDELTNQREPGLKQLAEYEKLMRVLEANLEKVNAVLAGVKDEKVVTDGQTRSA